MKTNTNFKYVAFDFDGTLCDSFEVFKEAFAVVAKEFRLRDSDLDSLDLRSKTTKQILSDLGVSLIQLPFVVRRGRQEMFRLREKLVLFDGAENLLEILISQGIKVGILTSNSKELVQSLISHELLQHIEIARPSPLFGKSKVIKSLLNTKNLNGDEFIYIGDETRDIEAAMAAGVICGGVVYGYNNEVAIRAQSPDYIFNSIAEITDFFQF